MHSKKFERHSDRTTLLLHQERDGGRGGGAGDEGKEDEEEDEDSPKSKQDLDAREEEKRRKIEEKQRLLKELERKQATVTRLTLSRHECTDSPMAERPADAGTIRSSPAPGNPDRH